MFNSIIFFRSNVQAQMTEWIMQDQPGFKQLANIVLNMARECSLKQFNRYIKPEISSFGISYKSDHNKPMSIDFEINNLSYKNHLNLLDTKYYKFGFEYITQMGTPIRGGLIYKKMSLPSIDPISIFTFGTGKKISNVIIDFSGTYHMQTFSYPDLFVVEGDIRNTYDSVRDSQLNFQLGITYLY